MKVCHKIQQSDISLCTKRSKWKSQKKNQTLTIFQIEAFINFSNNIS